MAHLYQELAPRGAKQRISWPWIFHVERQKNRGWLLLMVGYRPRKLWAYCVAYDAAKLTYVWLFWTASMGRPMHLEIVDAAHVAFFFCGRLQQQPCWMCSTYWLIWERSNGWLIGWGRFCMWTRSLATIPRSGQRCGAPLGFLTTVGQRRGVHQAIAGSRVEVKIEVAGGGAHIGIIYTYVSSYR